MTLFNHLYRHWPLLLLLGLIGCASGANPVNQTFSALITESFGAGHGSKLPTQLNPAYRYLRVEVGGRPPVLLVLGAVDSHPQGDIESWYSATGEVIKIQNGRIFATAGLDTEWRAVQYSEKAPAWTELKLEGHLIRRSRDEMPGYRTAITDQLEIKPWSGLPPITLASSMPAQLAGHYRWFREVTLSSSAQPLPPAWFAWGLYGGKPTVVYSEQCLSLVLCLKMQRWPMQEGMF